METIFSLESGVNWGLDKEKIRDYDEDGSGEGESRKGFDTKHQVQHETGVKYLV
ncbi:MAG: hypothetical protein ABSB71_12915 [Candidatus Bathyarchaeia archaeon]|jgi:hypothetical protein